MRYIISLVLALSMMNVSYAVVINPNTIIDRPVRYNNTIVDLTRGNFIVRQGGELTINNSKVIGELSPTNPTLILVDSGSLKMAQNDVVIYSPQVADHPYTQSLEYVIRTQQARVELTDNKFKAIHPFRVGLLITDSAIPTTGFMIRRNNMEGFHGVLYLINSNNVDVRNNKLLLNSYGNIVLTGNHGEIINNKIYFSGRDMLGNAIDIINADNAILRNNLLFTPTCHGIYVFASQHVMIESNNIIGGITYGITLLAKAELSKDAYAMQYADKHRLASQDITVIDNYFSQNRYGINASDIDGLIIKDNYFSQRFLDNLSRLFWTDNNNLLKNIKNLQWSDNFYKEAFTQDNGGANGNVSIVPFPESGGVSL